MKLSDVKLYEFVTREVWLHRGLFITRTSSNNFRYQGAGNTLVSKSSVIRDYTDFIYCDKFGRPLKNKKENKVKYDETKIVVTSSNGKMMSFENEGDALDAIADELEGSPRTKFTMFKPYQAIEPKRAVLTDLIRKIVG